MGSPRLAWRPLALLVIDGGRWCDLGGPPPGGSGFGKLGPRDMAASLPDTWKASSRKSRELRQSSGFIEDVPWQQHLNCAWTGRWQRFWGED